MDLSKLTKQEIIALRNSCEFHLREFDKREKCKIYTIYDPESKAEYCFKKLERVIIKLREMTDRETQCHELFREDSKTILSTRFIDKVEYDKHPDEWIYF